MSSFGGETAGGSSCTTPVKQSSCTHAEDRTCWQQWWGLETDITHLLHMWADPSTRTKTHTHVLSLSLPRMFTHTWEGEEEAKYSGICNLRLNGEMVYSVNSQCKGIWWENFKVTQQSNCRIKRQILECFKMFWLCKCHHKWSHKGLYLPHLCLKLHDI